MSACESGYEEHESSHQNAERFGARIMLRLLLIAGGIGLLASASVAQTLAEMDTATGMANNLNGGSTGPSAPTLPPFAPGAVPGATNAAAGFAPAPAVGLPPIPGGLPPAGAPGGLGPIEEPGVTGGGGGGVPQPGIVGQPTPTPQPTLTVLRGNRVYDAVTNALLEDAYQVSVPLTEKDHYADDGIHDNGIPGDGIRGQVTVVKGQFIGAETNSLKNQLIRLVRNSEEMPIPTFYGYHIMAINPTEEGRGGKAPNLLEKEAQRDQLLRDWNAKFLADYRVEKDNPRSDYYQLYVPDPPQPPTYPPPPGYVAPQKQVETGPGGVPVQQTPNIYNGDAVVNEIPV